MRWGKLVCDGEMQRRRCTECTLHGLGLNRTASRVLGWLPPALARRAGIASGQSRLWTALRMSELVELRHNATRALFGEVDSVVVLCTWARELLMRNGVPADKICLSRHGLLRRGERHRSRCLDGAPRQTLRLVYLGRLHPTKGVELLVRAVHAAANAAVELDVYGIVQGPADERYGRQLTKLSEDDGRIHYLEPVPVEDVWSTLERYDMLAVPSQWLETGPLVVLEAFDAGIPVLGSALGGIAELVQHGINGLLVQPHDEVDAWTSMLETLVAEPRMVDRLAEGVRPPRGMEDVAREMLIAYKSVQR
jgi:glycosyltransferase involved in cell wall biosynthesis